MPKPVLKLALSRKLDIEFFQNFLIYKGEEILNSDVDGIAYLHTRTRRSINFIPVGVSHSYVVSIRALGTLHQITFSGDRNEDIFRQLAAAVEVLIKPFVVVNLLLSYVKNNKLEIGDLTITPEGLYKKRTWWRSPEFLPWSKYYNSNINKGNVFVLKRDEGKKEYASFFGRSMSSLNAIVLPDVINFIFLKNGVLDETTRKQIIERKTQLTEASAQEAIQELHRCPNCKEIVDDSQEFCAKCGSALTIKTSVHVGIKQEVSLDKIETPASTKKYCANCGNQISKDSKFCGSCGTTTIST